MDTNHGLIQFDIVASLNPLNADGEDQLDRLLGCIDKAYSEYTNKPVRAIILRQIEPSYTLDVNALTGLRSHTWRDVIIRRLCKMRLAIELIRSSDIVWVYITEFNCLSFYYELAIACDRVLCINPDMHFGFPELQLDLPCIGGVLEAQSLAGKQIFEHINELSYFRPADWQHALLAVPWILDASFDLVVGANILETVIKQLDRISFRRERKHSHVGELIDALKNWTENGIERSGFEKSFTGDGLIDAWKEQFKKRQNIVDFAGWLIDAAASYLCAFNLGAKAAQHIFRTYTKTSSISALIVDVEYKRPPIPLIKSALNLSASVILWARSERILMRAVELVWADLKLQFSADEFERFRHQISWCFSDTFPNGPHPVFQFGNEGLWQLLLEQRMTSCWQISREEDGFICLEVDQAIDPGPLSVFEQLGIFCVKTKLFRGDIPLNYLIRIWAIKELLAFGQCYHANITDMIELLREGGWGFLGREPQIEHFSFEMIDFFKDLDEPIHFCGQSLELFITQPKVWKAIIRRKNEGQGFEDEVVAPQISFHFLYFSVMLWWRLQLEPSFADLDKQDLATLIAAALGMPPSVGRPDLFIEQRGIRRCQIYIDQRWPDTHSSVVAILTDAEA